MKQFDFLNGLDKIKDQALFQEFIVEMGISKHVIHIPLNEVDTFTVAAKKMQPTTVKQLKELVKRFSGSLEE